MDEKLKKLLADIRNGTADAAILKRHQLDDKLLKAAKGLRYLVDERKMELSKAVKYYPELQAKPAPGQTAPQPAPVAKSNIKAAGQLGKVIGAAAPKPEPQKKQPLIYKQPEQPWNENIIKSPEERKVISDFQNFEQAAKRRRVVENSDLVTRSPELITPEYQQKIDESKQQQEATFKKIQEPINKTVNEFVQSIKVDDFFVTGTSGQKVLDVNKVTGAANKLAAKQGGGGATKEIFLARLENELPFQLNKPAANQRLEEIVKEKHGKPLKDWYGDDSEDVKRVMGLINTYERQQKELPTTTITNLEKKTTELQATKYAPALTQVAQQYGLNSQEYKTAFKQLNDQYKSEVRDMTLKEQKRIGRILLEQQELVKGEIAKVQNLSEAKAYQLKKYYEQAYADVNIKKQQEQFKTQKGIDKLAPAYSTVLSYVSAFDRALAGWGDFIASINPSLDGGVGDFLRGRKTASEASSVIQPELKGTGWLNPKSYTIRGADMMGAMSPGLLAGAVTGNPIVGATAMLLSETAQIGGDTYKNVLKETGDPNKANKAMMAVTRHNLGPVNVGLSLVSGSMIFKAIKAKNWVQIASAGVLENVSEIPQEILQGYEQAIAEGSFKGTRTEYIKLHGLETAKEVFASTFFTMPGLGMAGHMASKIGSNVNTAAQQHAANVVSKGSAVVQSLNELNGINNPETAAQQAQLFNNVNKKLADLNQVNPNPDVQKAYFSIADQTEQLRKKAQTEKDPVLKDKLDQQVKGMEQQASELLDGKQSFVKVTLPTGDTYSVLENEVDALLAPEELGGAVARGLAAVEVVGEGKNKEALQQKIDALNIKDKQPAAHNENGEYIIEEEKEYDVLTNDGIKTLKAVGENINGTYDFVDEDGNLRSLRPNDLAIYEKETTKETGIEETSTTDAIDTVGNQPQSETKTVAPVSVDVDKKSNWRDEFDKTDDVNRKKAILRAIADVSKSDKELSDVLDRIKDLPDESNIAWSVAHNPNSSDATFEKAITNKKVYDNSSADAIKTMYERRGIRVPEKIIKEAETTKKESAVAIPELESVESTAKALDGKETKEIAKLIPKIEKGQHQIHKDETSSPLYDLLQSGTSPNDIYTGMKYYGDMKEKSYQESAAVIKKVKGNPDAEVTIYRSVPKGINEINEGDWISLSKTYAKEHGMHHEDSKLDMPVISMKVKAKDIFWDSNDLNEFAYFPENAKTTNQKISEAYHSDKASGKETELTKAVESLLANKPQKEVVVPIPALKDVESTAKALEGKDTSIVKGSSVFRGQQKGQPIGKWFTGSKEFAKKFSEALRGGKKSNNGEVIEHTVFGRVLDFPYLVTEYARVSDKLGEVFGVTKQQVIDAISKTDVPLSKSETIKIHSLLENKGFQELLVSKGFDYVKAKENLSIKDHVDTFLKLNDKTQEQLLSEAYHKAKSDNSNPELVEAVESLLANQPQSETKEQPFERGKYRVEYQNGKRVVLDISGKKPKVVPEYIEQEVKVKSGTKRGAVVKQKVKNKAYTEALRNHDKNYNYNFGERADQSKMPDVQSNEQGADWVIQNSSNPAELAQVYNSLPKEATELSEVERRIADHGVKITSNGYKRFGDKNNVTMSKAKAYFKADGQEIDDLAQELSDESGVTVTPQDIVNFIDRFPQGVQQATAKQDSALATEAAHKFESLTGITITPRIAAQAALQNVAPEVLADIDNTILTSPLDDAARQEWLNQESEKNFEDEETFNNLDDYEQYPADAQTEGGGRPDLQGVVQQDTGTTAAGGVGGLTQPPASERTEQAATAEQASTGRPTTDIDFLHNELQTFLASEPGTAYGLQPELKRATSVLVKAQKDLTEAQNKLSKEKGTQADIFGNAAHQSGLFGPASAQEATDILTPLRNRVKEARAEVERISSKLADLEGQAKGQQSLFSENTTYYETEVEGETVQYTATTVNDNYPNQSSLFDQEQGREDQENISEEQPDNDNITTIKGIWQELKDLQFTGKTKVRSHVDVAHIMRLLENKQGEHAFAVHIDQNGNANIQFLSIGSTVGTVVDPRLVLSGFSKFKSKKIYLVHNHPSGNLAPSKADEDLTDRIREGLREFNVEVEHVIMDTYENEYTLIDKWNGIQQYERSKEPVTEKKLKVHIFSDMEVLKKPIATVSSSTDVTAFIQQFRFSGMPKRGMLVMNRRNDIIANYTLMKDFSSSEEILRLIADVPTVTSVIFYSNVDDLNAINNNITAQLKRFDIKVLDYVRVTPGKAVPEYYDYVSAADQSMLREVQAKYGTNMVAEADFSQWQKHADFATKKMDEGVHEETLTEVFSKAGLPEDVTNEILANARARSTKVPRIPVKPITGGKPKKLNEIIFDASTSLKTRLVYAKKLGRRTAGATYNPSNAGIKIKFEGNLDYAAHEIGHSLDDKFNFLGELQADSQAISQLKPFSKHGSTPPKGHPNPQIYTLGEGVAEWIRALIVNPISAEQAAPNVYAIYKNSIPQDVQDKLTSFSEDVRAWAGATGRDMILANVEIDPKEGKGWVARTFGREDNSNNFHIGWVDRLAANWINPLRAFDKAFEYAKGLKGVDQVLPENDPILLSRIFNGMDTKFGEILQTGMIDSKGNVLKDANGNPKNLRWLLQPMDQMNLEEDMKDVISYMIAERTVELAERFGRSTLLSGIGGGVFSDLDVARKTLAELTNGDTDKYNRIKEASRRYREFANDILQYMVDKGRISQESFDMVTQNNLQYVAMQRVLETEPEMEVEGFKGRGGSLGSKKEAIQKIRGSAKQIKNPYASLLDVLHKSIKESDRNEILRAFRDMLHAPRGMYQGGPISFSDIGTLSKQGEKNTIAIFVDGKAEYWRFQDDIYKALKGLDHDYYRLPNWITFLPKLLRNTVTHFPVFAMRNWIRDFQSRMILSNNNKWASGITNLVGNKEDWHQIARAGGLNAGYYLKDKNFYYGLLSEAMVDMNKRGVAVLNGAKLKNLWHKYEGVLQKSETANRVAEYRSAFDKAKRKGLDNYNASLYAAGQARGLIDFSAMGHYMRIINQIIPFSNAAVQGIRAGVNHFRENPGGFAIRLTLFSILPQMAMWALAHGDDDDGEEYEALPAYQRDMFWNFKIGKDRWFSIPKPFELAMPSAAIDRYMSAVKTKNANPWKGYAGQVVKAFMPFEDASLTGPFRPLIEILANKDFFRDKAIVPHHEANLDISLRKTEGASRLGKASAKAIQALVNLVNKEFQVDPSQMDHLIRGQLTYFGNMAIKISNIGTPQGEKQKLDVTDIGLIKRSPAYNSAPVQNMMEFAQRWQLTLSKEYKLFKDLSVEYFEATDPEKKDEMAKSLREYATNLLKKWKDDGEAKKKQEKKQGTTTNKPKVTILE